MSAMPVSLWVVVLLVALALVFDFMNGFHDAANSIATVVSTGVLKPQQAVIFAAFFNVLAIFVFHLSVAATVGKGIVEPGVVDQHVVFGALIGEYVMAYVFALERQLFRMRKNQLERRWQPLGYRPAKDIRLGIVGLGSIGRELALTAAHFGIRVTGLNRSGRPCDAVEKVHTADDMGAFLAELDYVVLTLPATPHTRHFINAAALRLMKPSAVLINVGRGSSIIEADLVQALRDGVIGGALLDVFENEPLAGDSPLWLMPNVFITPHTSAISFPEEIARVFIDNYQRFCRGERLRHVVDFELGY